MAKRDWYIGTCVGIYPNSDKVPLGGLQRNLICNEFLIPAICITESGNTRKVAVGIWVGTIAYDYV